MGFVSFHRSRHVFYVSLTTIGALAIGLGTSAFAGAGDGKDVKKDSPAKADLPKAAGASKYTIPDVMKKAYKGNDALVKKVIDGKGTKEDTALLLALNKALASSKPRKGELDDWTKRTTALLKAAEASDKGDKAGFAALKAAADCRGCHTLHRPPAE